MAMEITMIPMVILFIICYDHICAYDVLLSCLTILFVLDIW
jgi:hypothetical protein